MYSIPAGGFRHPYPALAMNASMSRWVLRGGTLELALGFGTLCCAQSMGTDQSQEIRVVSSAENAPRGCGWCPWVEEWDIPWAQAIAWARSSQSWGGVWGL